MTNFEVLLLSEFCLGSFLGWEVSSIGEHPLCECMRARNDSIGFNLTQSLFRLCHHYIASLRPPSVSLTTHHASLMPPSVSVTTHHASLRPRFSLYHHPPCITQASFCLCHHPSCITQYPFQQYWAKTVCWFSWKILLMLHMGMNICIIKYILQ